MNKVIYMLFIVVTFICSLFVENTKSEILQSNNANSILSENSAPVEFYFADAINKQNNNLLIATHYSHGSHSSHISHYSHYSSK